MLKQGPKFLHWNYFLALESDLERLSRYVEFTVDNYATYSLEMAHLLLASASEVDVVLKGLCKKIQPRRKPQNIEQYRKIVAPQFPKLSSMKIRIPRYGLDITPWDNWQSDQAPDWWRAYNRVKHQRDSYFSEAKLQYTVAVVAGLFAVVLYFYQEEAEKGHLVPSPKLLTPPEDCIAGIEQSDFGITLVYKL